MRPGSSCAWRSVGAAEGLLSIKIGLAMPKPDPFNQGPFWPSMLRKKIKEELSTDNTGMPLWSRFPQLQPGSGIHAILWSRKLCVRFIKPEAEGAGYRSTMGACLAMNL